MFNEKTQMYDGIIYCFTNKINNKKYVGQTQQTLKQRISNHLSKTNKKYYFQNALLKYGIDNFDIEILEAISADTKSNLKLKLNTREKFYISKYKTTDHNYGYNLTKGGECASIKNGRKIYQFDLLTGKLLKEYDSMAEAAKAVNGSEDTNNIYICALHQTKQAYGFMWEFNSECHRKYVIDSIERPDQRKVVIQYDIFGNIIKKWNSIKEASKYCNVDSTTIVQCCQGKVSTIKNQVWRYESDDFNKYRITFRGKIIACYDDNNNLVHIFKNAPSAANYYNCSDSCIKSALRNSNKKSVGYFWRYYTDDFDMKDLIFKTPENMGLGIVA